MNTSVLDQRGKDEIIAEIEKKAGSYTPEWKFNYEDPDIGTALALVYADLFANTIKRLNRIVLKHEIAFFNSLDASLLPAAPAHGYVQFSLVTGAWNGVEVSSKTIVSADDAHTEKGIIEYETVDDVYVTPAKVEYLYQTADREDYISQIFCPADEVLRDVPLFSFQAQNLQEHVCYVAHDTILQIEHNAVICLCMFAYEEKKLDAAMLQLLNNNAIAQIDYYSADGFIPFMQQQVQEGKLICRKGDQQPPFAKNSIGGIESYWMRCRILQVEPLKKLSVSHLHFETSSVGIEPDTVYGNGVECNLNQYVPFGEQISLYTEVYFGSREVLGKQGAQVELSFSMDFAKIPLGTAEDDRPWEWVMKRSAFKPNPEYDITIAAVLWEYYNGSGWARLFTDDCNSHIFSAEGGTVGQYKTLSFTVPADISQILINAEETYYIRARVSKVNNMYKTLGNYIIPVLSNTVLSYHYHNPNAYPSAVVTQNNLVERVYQGRDIGRCEGFSPFCQTGYKNSALYLGFSIPPIGAPLKYLATLSDYMDRSDNLLIWEYYSEKKWSEINLVDETENFSKTGIITILGSGNYVRKRLFGKDLYWIRICDVNGAYGAQTANVSRPVLSGFYENTTKIMNVDRRETEHFTMMVYQEHMRFMLLYHNIYEIEVFVNEKETLSDQQLQQLQLEDRVIVNCDSIGLVTQAWVRWECVEDFIDSTAQDRHVRYSPTEGYILFGNGQRGMIPPPSRQPNIRVIYQTGGGRHTNVEKGRINKLNRSIGFINAVTNPQVLTGGNDAETITEALTRNAAIIRTQKKAVTLKDYEEIAKLASRDIRLVKCFSCYDDQGMSCKGAVTLVVLQKNFREGKPQFERVKNDIYLYLKDRMYGALLANHKFFIIEPQFVEIKIRVEAVVTNFNMVFKVKKEIQSRLENFLNPNDAKSDWNIGVLPGNIQVKNIISDVSGISYIRNVFISTFISGDDGWQEVDQIPNRRYVFPLNGAHEVVILME